MTPAVKSNCPVSLRPLLLSTLFLSGAWLAAALTGCGSSSYGNTTSPPVGAPGSIGPALWVANGTNVLEFNPTVNSQLSPPVYAPTLTLNSSAFTAPQGVAFDGSGNLWVVDGGSTTPGTRSRPALYQFSYASLNALSTPAITTPNATITSDAFVYPQQGVFDGNGNLWVSDPGANEIFEFTPSQLLSSNGGITPNLTLKSNPAFFGAYGDSETAALGIAFDSSGDLWVANNGNSQVYEFNAASLAAASGSVTLPPAVVLSDDGKGSLAWPWTLAFDSSGNLWVSNVGFIGVRDALIAPENTVVEFSKTELTATGSPSPAVVLTVGTENGTGNGNGDYSSPKGLAFSTSGELAVSVSASPLGVNLYDSSQLSSGGMSTFTFIGSSAAFQAPAGITFGPLITPGGAGMSAGTMN